MDQDGRSHLNKQKQVHKCLILDSQTQDKEPLIAKWSQIGIVQAVGYIGVRSPTKGHEQATNQLPESNSQWYLH